MTELTSSSTGCQASEMGAGKRCESEPERESTAGEAVLSGQACSKRLVYREQANLKVYGVSRS